MFAPTVVEVLPQTKDFQSHQVIPIDFQLNLCNFGFVEVSIGSKKGTQENGMGADGPHEVSQNSLFFGFFGPFRKDFLGSSVTHHHSQQVAHPQLSTSIMPSRVHSTSTAKRALRILAGARRPRFSISDNRRLLGQLCFLLLQENM